MYSRVVSILLTCGRYRLISEILEAPEFISRGDAKLTGPTKVIQPEGTTVQFKCLASGKPSPDIRWKKNGKILSEDEYGLTQFVLSDLFHW
jgi:hypothetical protein